jgi:hypothetical protein
VGDRLASCPLGGEALPSHGVDLLVVIAKAPANVAVLPTAEPEDNHPYFPLRPDDVRLVRLVVGRLQRTEQYMWREPFGQMRRPYPRQVRDGFGMNKTLAMSLDPHHHALARLGLLHLRQPHLADPLHDVPLDQQHLLGGAGTLGEELDHRFDDVQLDPDDQVRLYGPVERLGGTAAPALAATRIDNSGPLSLDRRGADAGQIPPGQAEPNPNIASEQGFFSWGGLDSNQRPTDYESAALTD